MPRSGLTGSRIRERRVALGLRQTALAQSVEISAAYLNLIEHNKRRIGGKLLVDLAERLDVEPNALTQGADQELLQALGDAVSAQPSINVEGQSAEDFAGRFGGWAKLVVGQSHRLQSLEQTVMALTDRLTHDPQLAASMHEMLSVVTAIRSTSGILAGEDDLDPEWRNRFQRNLYEDSQRLAQSSQALVEYLDSEIEDDSEGGLTLPQEELEHWLAVREFHIPELERALPISVDDILSGAQGFQASPVALSMARTFLQHYAADAAKLPKRPFLEAIAKTNCDPMALASLFSCDLATVMRRLSALPPDEALPRFGLVQCDGSGTVTFRKPLEEFPLPKFGATCPLWPLYQALQRPMDPIKRIVEQAGRRSARFMTYAVSQPAMAVPYGFPQIWQATMLIRPADSDETTLETALPVGSSCRICPRADCIARREPSILTTGF